MSLLIKICGLSTEESVETAIAAGADMIGLNFHPKSPRYVSLERASALANLARGRTKIVALVVDGDDSRLAEIASAVVPEMWQFHGTERYERLRDVRSVFGLPIMKALGVSEAADLQAVRNFAPVADRILLDAKPPKDAAYPGGHGRPFDWDILAALPPGLGFMLSGGLTIENVGEAIRRIRAMGLSLQGVDLSSGVESAPGVKDLGKIRAFIAAVREADAR
ncbi:MAG: phosphoribosylanthranilate isomerase [Rhabdaerophilum sp.]